MVDVDKAVVAKLKRNGIWFEVLVDPDKALEFKRGKKIPMEEMLAYPQIYHDVRKGDLVSEEELQKNFGTTNTRDVAEKIIEDGDMQLTTEQRREFTERKRKEIAGIISRRGINPQTNAPHPPQRILNVMEQAGVRVDPFVNAESQINQIVKDLKTLLPIKFQTVELEIEIPPQHTGRLYSVLHRIVGNFKERWLNDGSLAVVVKIPAGMQADLFKKIGDLTKGEFKSKILKKVDV